LSAKSTAWKPQAFHSNPFQSGIYFNIVFTFEGWEDVTDRKYRKLQEQKGVRRGEERCSSVSLLRLMGIAKTFFVFQRSNKFTMVEGFPVETQFIIRKVETQFIIRKGLPPRRWERLW
jgi:hypothetical protein